MSNDPLAMFWIVGVVTQCQRERMSSRGCCDTVGGGRLPMEDSNGSLRLLPVRQLLRPCSWSTTFCICLVMFCMDASMSATA